MVSEETAGGAAVTAGTGAAGVGGAGAGGGCEGGTAKEKRASRSSCYGSRSGQTKGMRRSPDRERANRRTSSDASSSGPTSTFHSR